MSATHETWSEEKTTSKIAINSQSNASLQSPANESYRNRLMFGAPQFPGTACNYHSFARCQITSHYAFILS
jgi:hypothetical protein